jgi:polysaccharide biosynthesis protein PslJ
MTGYGPGPAALLPGHDADVGRPPRRIDAVTLLSCYAFLLMAIPSSLVVGSFGAAGGPAALLAVAILCWYLVARQHPGLGLDRGRQPVRVAATIFAGAVVAAYISASRYAVPAAQQNGADRGLIVLAGWVGVLALAADGIDQADRLRTLLRRIVMLATAMAALGVIEFCTGVDLTKYIVLPGLSVHQQVTDLVSRNGLVRVTATTGQPLEFNAVLAMSLPIALHQARFAPAALRVRRWLQVALITAAVPMTGSRSAFFGLAVICIVLLPTWHRRDRLRACLAGLAAPALAWLVKPSLASSFTALFGQLGTDRSSLSRADAYSEAVPYIAAHPWLGQGFQTFFPQTYFFVDNQYLTSLLETGGLGLLALVACFATGWFTARSARATAADARTRDLGQCLAASIAVGAVCFASFDALSFSIAAGLFFLLLGCVGAAWRLGRAQQLAGN